MEPGRNRLLAKGSKEMKRIFAVLATTALLVAMMAMPAAAQNVNVGAINVDIVDVNDNTVVLQAQVPVGIAANVCDVNAAVLVQEFHETGSADCEADANAVAEINRGIVNRGKGGNR